MTDEVAKAGGGSVDDRTIPTVRDAGCALIVGDRSEKENL